MGPVMTAIGTSHAQMVFPEKDGTYSVVPRVPAAEITPEKLNVLGSVAKKYNLNTKITGGQRVDLFGARLNELPAIWTMKPWCVTSTGS